MKSVIETDIPVGPIELKIRIRPTMHHHCGVAYWLPAFVA